MAERGELEYLPRVTEGLIERMGDELNLVAVDVTTAVELDDYLRDLIKKKASSELGKDIVLNEHVDKSILGGIIMSTKDERIDASLLTQVEKTREALKYHGFTPVKSPCPHDGHTVRQDAKELIAKLAPAIPDLYDHLAAAMRKGALGELWPAAKTRKEMRETYFRYMGK